MTEFATKAELEAYLNGMCGRYGALYAHMLWDNGVSTSSELANASVETLQEAGVSKKIHAENIIKEASRGAANQAGGPGKGH